MGRHAGWLAVYGGMAGGADIILIPEEPFNINEICDLIKKRHGRGKDFSIVVVSEGAQEKTKDLITKDAELDSFGHIKLGGIGDRLAKMIEKNTGYETRSVVLGHVQRGGSPTAFDRVLGTRVGVAAIDLVHHKKFGNMVSLSGNEIISVPLSKAVAKLKTVDKKLYDIAKVFFG
jgi:6-phosphofructokinase 1